MKISIELYRPEGFPSVEELTALKNMEVDVVDNRLFHRANRASDIAMVRIS